MLYWVLVLICSLEASTRAVSQYQYSCMVGGYDWLVMMEAFLPPPFPVFPVIPLFFSVMSVLFVSLCPAWSHLLLQFFGCHHQPCNALNYLYSVETISLLVYPSFEHIGYATIHYNTATLNANQYL